MKNRIDKERAIEAEVASIMKHVLPIRDQKERIAAEEAIDHTILDPNERQRADFLKGLSREAIVRARIKIAQITKSSQK